MFFFLLLANPIISSIENSKCEKNLLDEELNRQKAKLITTGGQRHKQSLSPTKSRSNINERLQKQPITTIIKSNYNNSPKFKREKHIIILDLVTPFTHSFFFSLQ